MKIFVTGATGKVGSRLVPYLIEQGHDVYALVRDEQRALFLKEAGAHLVIGDLQTANLTTSLVDMDAVIHAAAQFRGNPTLEQARVVNVDSTIKLANEALAAGVTRFVYVSTGLVYGNLTPDQAIRESDHIQPTENLYPKTKVEAEKALQQLANDRGLDLKIVRLAFVYGDGDQHLTEFMPIMGQWTPDSYVSLVHHQDVDQALMLAAVSQTAISQIYNAADDTPITVADLLAATDTQSNNEATLSMGKWQNTLDNTLIKQELGYQPKFPAYQDAVQHDAL